MSEHHLTYARARLDAAVEEIVKARTDEVVQQAARRAYEHGLKAGRHERAIEVERLVYRRGYFTGYAAGKRKLECSPDEAAPGGRPRKITV